MLKAEGFYWYFSKQKTFIGWLSTSEQKKEKVVSKGRESTSFTGIKYVTASK